MKKQTVISGLLSLVLLGTLTPAAMAEIFQRTITLAPGGGNFAIGDLGIGDEVVLTLVNPTNKPLTFETTENIGNEKSWLVPANNKVTVNFKYTKPFDDDVEFVVKDLSSTNAEVARGTFIPAHMGERTTSYQQQTTVRQNQTTTPMQPTVRETGSTMTETETQQNVRGFW